MTITAAEHARRNILAADVNLRDARQRTDLNPEDQTLEIDLANERLNEALDAWQCATDDVHIPAGHSATPSTAHP